MFVVTLLMLLVDIRKVYSIFIDGTLLKRILRQTLSIGNSVLISQHLNGHVTCVTV